MTRNCFITIRSGHAPLTTPAEFCGSGCFCVTQHLSFPYSVVWEGHPQRWKTPFSASDAEELTLAPGNTEEKYMPSEETNILSKHLLPTKRKQRWELRRFPGCYSECFFQIRFFIWVVLNSQFSYTKLIWNTQSQWVLHSEALTPWLTPLLVSPLLAGIPAAKGPQQCCTQEKWDDPKVRTALLLILFY